jgi:hypothetical protein
VPPRFSFVGCKGRDLPRSPRARISILSRSQLERFYAGSLKLASLDDSVLAALVEQVLAGDEFASSS